MVYILHRIGQYKHVNYYLFHGTHVKVVFLADLCVILFKYFFVSFDTWVLSATSSNLAAILHQNLNSGMLFPAQLCVGPVYYTMLPGNFPLHLSTEECLRAHTFRYYSLNNPSVKVNYYYFVCVCTYMSKDAFFKFRIILVIAWLRIKCQWTFFLLTDIFWTLNLHYLLK